MKKYKQHVESTLSNLLRSPVSFWGTDTYNVFFEDGKLAQLKIKNIMPELITIDEANLSKHITTTVEQYFTLNLWEKIWWRLTKPINQYMMLHDILTLNEMKEAIAEDSVSKSIVIYNQSSLSKHLDFWDSLMTSWRYLLDNLVLAKSTRYKESLIRDSLIYMKVPFNGAELICKINQYVELMDKQFNGLGSYYIYLEKERVLDNLQNEYNVCEKILTKLNLANNQHSFVEVGQCAEAVAKVKEQVEYRLNTLSMEYISVEEMVDELLSQDYLTSAERSRLNGFKESIRKKQEQVASDAYFDNMIKQMQEINSRQDQALDQLDRGIEQLDRRIEQLQENASKRDQDFKELQENASKRDQDFKELQENASKRDQDFKELQENASTSKRDQFFKELTERVVKTNGELGQIVQRIRQLEDTGQFFFQQADTENGLLIEQMEEEYTDEETSNSNTRMP